MKKIIYGALVIGIILLFVGYFGNRASQDTVLSKDIHALLEQGIKQIDLTTMTDFEWDAVSAFGPYTTNDIIEDSMGIQFKGDSGGIEVIEDRFLLVFANGKHAVKTVILSGNTGIMQSKIINY